MNKLLYLCLCLIFSCNLFAKELSKSFVSYDGYYDSSVIISPAEKLNSFYIYFEGFNHRFDRHVFLYQKQRINNSAAYRMLGTSDIHIINSKENVFLKGVSTPYLEVVLDNNDLSKLVFNGNADMNNKKQLKLKYLKQQLNVSTKSAARKLIKSAQDNFHRVCGSRINVNINWSRFRSKSYETVPSKAVAYLNALQKICKIDQWHRDSVTDIKIIKIMPSENINEHNAVIENRAMTLKIGYQVPNLSETSYQLLLNLFDRSTI